MRAAVTLVTLALAMGVSTAPALALGQADGLDPAAEPDVTGTDAVPPPGDPASLEELEIRADGGERDPGGVRTAQQGTSEPQVTGEEMVGLFELDEGDCEGTSGSHFRMVQPDGEPGEGPYVSNADSPCDDNTITSLRPGTDGGLATGQHQPHPDEAFSATGDGQAEAIIEPQTFFGVDFAVATNPTDPQTDLDTFEPVIAHDGAGNLEGDVRAFGVAWNHQHFNQGAPKPDGNTDGHTAAPSGTYDASTGAFTLSWTSQIEGGPFDGFTGEWQLEGTFVPADDGADTSGGTTQVDDAEASDEGDGAGAADGSPGGQTASTTSETDAAGAAGSASASGDGDRATPETGPGVSALVGLALLLGGWLLRRSGLRQLHAPDLPAPGSA